MLVADYRRRPGKEINTPQPSLIVVEPWRGFVFIFDDDGNERRMPPPRRSCERNARRSAVDWWLGLAGATAWRWCIL